MLHCGETGTARPSSARFQIISYPHTSESTDPFDRDEACKARAGKSKEEEVDKNNDVGEFVG